MTTIDTRPETGSSVGTDTPAGRAVSGVMSWITTADHKRIGRLFIGFSVLFLVGISGHFRVRTARFGLVGLGAAILVLSVVLLIASPPPP